MIPTEIPHLPAYKKTSVIYITLTLIVLGSLAALPFLYVSVTVRAASVIRPVAETTSLRSLVAGRLKNVHVQENEAVKKGQPLFVLESAILTERETYLLARQAELKTFVADLDQLVGASPDPARVRSVFYAQSWLNHAQKLAEATTRFKKAKADYDRNHRLHRERVIADAEFETFQFELDKAGDELATLRQNQRTQWQTERQRHAQDLRDVDNQWAQLQEEKNNLVITAPVSGTVQQVAGAYAGSIVFANQELARLSPDTSLLVEAYISPDDIGLLQPGLPARFQVDAFNHHQWGMATGSIMQISNDIYLVNDRPVFKVKCSLNTVCLQLKNGYKGC
jgi:HlyD family secretion protein